MAQPVQQKAAESYEIASKAADEAAEATRQKASGLAGTVSLAEAKLDLYDF
jgi:hypothetical protein